MRKVLAFFGAFNPPTTAHLELADFARRETGREGMIFVPSRTDYIRDFQGKDFAYGSDRRLEMLEALAAERPWMFVTGWELEQESQPRTWTTLCHLREEGWAPSLLLGSDKLPELEHGWLYVHEITGEFGIVCLTRGADECRKMIEEDPYLRTLSPRITVLDTPEETKGVSSTQVRRLVREISTLVPQEIIHLLFTDSCTTDC